MRVALRRAVAAIVLALGVTLGPAVAALAPASAHSLDSSTLSVHQEADGADATVSLPLQALADAMDVDAATLRSDPTEAVDYLAAHLSATGTDGVAWAESYADPVVETVEGVESVSVEVALDAGGADPSAFTLSYDAITGSVDGHEAVVVLTDTAGEVSTAGVLDADATSLAIGESDSTGVLDMVGHGLTHVLAGADHLLFLLVLLLPAPFLYDATRRRWHGRSGWRPTLRRVLATATAFTLGHSLTLVAAGLGWVSVPSRPVEVLIALSVGLGAVHALRPLVPRGEVLIAGGFGLVHGLAFAAILRDLGLGGGSAIAPLLAFNVGVELAQLIVIALLLPSLLVLSRTRRGGAFRVAGALVALAASTGWLVERLGWAANPFAGAEAWVVAHPWWVVAGLAALAAAAYALDRVTPRRRTPDRARVPAPASL